MRKLLTRLRKRQGPRSPSLHSKKNGEVPAARQMILSRLNRKATRASRRNHPSQAKGHRLHHLIKNRIFRRLIHLAEFAIAICLVLAILVGALIFKLSREPLSLPFVSQVVGNLINNPTTGSAINIGQSNLTWDRESQNFIIELLQVKLEDPSVKTAVFVPRLRIRFNFIAMFVGRFYPEQITADGPVITVEDPKLLLARFQQAPASDKSSEEPSDKASDKPSDKHSLPTYLNWIQELNINDFKLLVGSGRSAQVISFPTLNFAFKPAVLAHGKGRDQAASARGSVTVKNLHPIVLAKFVPELGFLKLFDLPLQLELGYGINDQGQLERFSFFLNGGSGRLVGNSFKMGQLPITSFKAKAFYSNFSTIAPTASIASTDSRKGINLKTRQENSVSADNYEPSPTMALSDVELVITDGPVISGTALVSVPADKKSNMVILASLGIDRVDLDLLQNYWPLDLARDTRQWFVDNFHRGELTDVGLNLHLEQTPTVQREVSPLAPPGTKPPPPTGGEWISVKTDGSLGFKDALVIMTPNMPPATNASGAIRFDDNLATVSIHHAEIDGLDILPSVVTLSDLISNNPRLKVNAAARGSLSNALQLLSAPALNITQTLGVTPDQADSGEVKANLELELPLSPMAPDYHLPPRYHVIASISGMKFDRLIGAWGVNDSELNLDVDNDRVQMDGLLRVEGIEIHPSMRLKLDPRIDDFLHLTVSLVLDAEGVKRLGLDSSIWVNGEIPIEATYDLERNGRADLRMGVNLINADFRAFILPGLLLPRSAGLAGRVNLVLRDNQVTALSSLNLRGVNSNAVIDISGEMDRLGRQTMLHINRMEAGENRLYGNIGFKPNGGLSVFLRGDSLNVSILSEPEEQGDSNPMPRPLLKPKDNQPVRPEEAEDSQDRLFRPSRTIRPEMVVVNEPFEPNFPLLIDIKINQLILGKDRAITDTVITGFYDGLRWQTASIDAMLNSTYPVSLRLSANEDFRTLKIKAANSGEFIRVVTGKKVMNGGVLTITGRIELIPRGLTANVLIEKFRMTNMPVLSKVIGLLTITGIADALTGEGLAFDELSAQVQRSGLVTVVENAHVTGSAVGLTIGGKMLAANPRGAEAGTSPRLDFSGTIVPAYGISSTIKTIPLLGWLLTGNKGEGLLAFSYRVRGSLEDPKIAINPLSVLAPGFIQNWINSIGKANDKKNKNNQPPEATENSPPSKIGSPK
ncbi:MAG: AsmA-like C-terminal domain-containing protein [Candidatus Pacebacteria bacterium]|nr:AsmA-like C-terminal domain-containing protein [Candidatus Paceibacterota bacterium]